MKASSHGYDRLLTQSPALFRSFLKDRGCDGKFQAFNHGSVFLVTSPHPEAIQELIKSCFFRTKDTPVTQEISRDLEAVRQELGPKTKY